MSILDEILDHKRREVEEARRRRPPEALAEALRSHADPVRGLRRALLEADAPAVIAEIKRRSPSKGLIREDFEPVACARAYAAGGAAALSVLTDERFFGGELAYLSAVRDAVSLPLLRKDFVVDPYQIDEARLAGADAVLLIVAALEPEQLADLAKVAAERGLDALVEVHDEAELEVALSSGAELIGVNNRNLRTFEVDLAVTERLAKRLPDSGAVLLVAESGIHEPEDIARLSESGARAFLVGESLMRQEDITKALLRLRRTS
ncbi:MAG: indole-3-glycerol phosphate synthase TrpC [Myxococcota bacterium]